MYNKYQITLTFDRNSSNWSFDNVPENFLFDRGYTGHEHLDEFGLINMNGRVYDAYLARFLSPDPFVQAPGYGQNYNRYSYVLNNPLKYTDPSGYTYLDYMNNTYGYFWYRGEYVKANSVGNTGNQASRRGGSYSYNGSTNEYSNGFNKVSFDEVFNNFICVNAYALPVDAIISIQLMSTNYNPNIQLVSAYNQFFFDYDKTTGAYFIPKTGIAIDPFAFINSVLDGSAGGGDSWVVTAAAGYMMALQIDLVTPDPSDVAWPKWAGHAVLGTASAIMLYSAGYSILNPNLEGTSTSRGNPTDWSFDPEINRLQNDKYYPPSSQPPKWFWPAIGVAGAYELYNNRPQPQPIIMPADNTYVAPRPNFPYP